MSGKSRAFFQISGGFYAEVGHFERHFETSGGFCFEVGHFFRFFADYISKSGISFRFYFGLGQKSGIFQILPAADEKSRAQK